MAQWAPRLNGLSQPGSCPIQTPLLTSATTVQPTEQWVQTDFTVSTAPEMDCCALACVTDPAVALIAASPPMARPEPRRKARRSTEDPAISDRMPLRDARRATPFVFFLNMVSLLLSPVPGASAASRALSCVAAGAVTSQRRVIPGTGQNRALSK